MLQVALHGVGEADARVAVQVFPGRIPRHVRRLEIDLHEPRLSGRGLGLLRQVFAGKPADQRIPIHLRRQRPGRCRVTLARGVVGHEPLPRRLIAKIVGDMIALVARPLGGHFP